MINNTSTAPIWDTATQQAGDISVLIFIIVIALMIYTIYKETGEKRK